MHFLSKDGLFKDLYYPIYHHVCRAFSHSFQPYKLTTKIVMAGAHQSYLNNVQKFLVFILPAFTFNRKKVRINVSGICQLSRDKFLPYFLVYIINLLMQTCFYGMLHHSVDVYPLASNFEKVV